jgi:hypothetical protein
LGVGVAGLLVAAVGMPPDFPGVPVDRGDEVDEVDGVVAGGELGTDRCLEMEVEDALGAVVEVAVAGVFAFMQGGKGDQAEAGEEERQRSRSLVLGPSRG